MKKFLFLCLVIGTILQSVAQDPEIVGTWYLRAFTADLVPAVPITNEDAPQNPTITINDDFTFEGIAACNTFTGTFVYDETMEYYVHEVFTPTTNDCNNEDYTNFETSYFNHFNDHYEEFLYIFYFGDFLLMEFGPGFGMKFQKTPFLGVNDTAETVFTVFPNPASEVLHIHAQSTPISSVTVYTMLGSRLFSSEGNVDHIDVSDFPTGLYFIEIRSEGKRQMKQFSKR